MTLQKPTMSLRWVYMNRREHSNPSDLESEKIKWVEYELDRLWCEHFALALRGKVLSEDEYKELLQRADKVLRKKHNIKNGYRRKL